MGRRPDRQLEQRRLDGPGAAHRRQDRAPGRRRAGRMCRCRLDFGEPVQGTERGLEHRPRRRARAQAHRLRAQQLPDRPVHRRSLGCRAWPGAGAGRRTRATARAARRALRGADAHACQLRHRPHARHGGVDEGGPCGRRAGAVGPGAFGRRRAGGPARQRCRLRRRLRLQVPERRPRRTGLRLGGTEACRALLAAAGGLDGACGALRIHTRLPAGAGHPPLPVRHPARCCRWPRWSAASIRCSRPRRLAAWARCAPSRWR